MVRVFWPVISVLPKLRSSTLRRPRSDRKSAHAQTTTLGHATSLVAYVASPSSICSPFRGNLTALAHRVLLADPFFAALASDTNRVGRRCHPQEPRIGYVVGPRCAVNYPILDNDDDTLPLSAWCSCFLRLRGDHDLVVDATHFSTIPCEDSKPTSDVRKGLI